MQYSALLVVIYPPRAQAAFLATARNQPPTMYCFISLSMQSRWPTMSLSQPSLAVTMCMSSCGWSHPPTSVQAFLLMQNPHASTQSDVTKSALWIKRFLNLFIFPCLSLYLNLDGEKAMELFKVYKMYCSIVSCIPCLVHNRYMYMQQWHTLGQGVLSQTHFSLNISSFFTHSLQMQDVPLPPL